MKKTRQSNLLPFVLFSVLSLAGTSSMSCALMHTPTVVTSNMDIGDGEQRLSPGGYQALSIPNHNSGHKNYRLSGLVKSQGGPVKVLLLDDVNFKLWKARQPHHVAYTISAVVEEQFQTPIEDKSYYLVAENLSQDAPVLFQHYTLRVFYDVTR